MPVPVWSVGQVLAAADVNNWFVPLAAQKTSDTPRATQSAVTSDPDLVVAVAANALYHVEAILAYEGGTQGSSDFKWQWTGPSGAVLTSSPQYKDTTGAVIAGGGQSLTFQLSAGTGGSGNTRTVSQGGTLSTAATSGNFTLQWAQNSSNSAATILHAGSSLVLTRIG